MEAAQVDRFKRLLAIPTISSTGPSSGAYADAVLFLKDIAEASGLKTTVLEPVTNKPILIVTLEGTLRDEPSILLHSHYDVVPAVLEKWSTDPFKPTEDKQGRIFARGTQDMKCAVMQHLEALCTLAQRSNPLQRTIHAVFCPDEEIGGEDGVGQFIQTDFFKQLKIGVVFDEGLANPENEFTVFYGERAAWWVVVHANGRAGHGSRFIEETALEKLLHVINQAMAFRNEQKKVYEGHGCAHAQAKKLGDVATLNLTFVDAGVKGSEKQGGYAINVIPTEARAGFDMRLPVTLSLEEMKGILDDWTKEEGVSYEFKQHVTKHCVSSIDRDTNSLFKAFAVSLESMGHSFTTEIFPAGTDSRYYRHIGLEAFGFSPIRNTPILLHDHNEFIHRDVFVEGIAIFTRMLTAVASE